MEDNCAAIFCFAAHSDATRGPSRNSANQGPPPAARGRCVGLPQRRGRRGSIVAVGETTAGSLLHRWRRVRVEDNCAVIFCFAAHSDATASGIQKFSKSRSSTRRARTRVGLPQRRGRRGSIVAVGETTAGSLLHRWRRVRVEDNCAVIFCFAAHSDATSAASRNSANQGPPPAACGHASASPNDGGGEDFRLWQTGYAALTFFCTGGVVSLIRRDTSSSLIVQMRSSAG